MRAKCSGSGMFCIFFGTLVPLAALALYVFTNEARKPVPVTIFKIMIFLTLGLYTYLALLWLCRKVRDNFSGTTFLNLFKSQMEERPDLAP